MARIGYGRGDFNDPKPTKWGRTPLKNKIGLIFSSRQSCGMLFRLKQVRY